MDRVRQRPRGPARRRPRPAAHRRPAPGRWRERGADRMDPVRFRFMEALERRPPLRMPAPPARCWTSAWPPCSTPTRRTWSRTRPRPAAAPEPSQAPGREAQDCAAADTPIDAPLPADTLASLARALDTGHAVPGAAPGAAAAGRVPRYLGQGQCQPPAAPIGTTGARQCRPAQFQQPGPPLAGADAPALANYLHQFLSYLDALAWMEQFDGAVAAAETARGSAKAGAKGCGQGG